MGLFVAADLQLHQLFGKLPHFVDSESL